MIIYVESSDDLKKLYDCSAMTWEGLREEDWELAARECGQADTDIYVTKGRIMNEICELTGNNKYPDDLAIVSLNKYKGLAIFVGARWMDDIVDNNAQREGWHPFGRAI